MIEFWLRTVRGIAYVSALFCLVVSVLLVANYLQLTTSDPLDSDALSSIRQAYDGDQDNEVLMGQIRSLDLIARKAYFTRRWQLRTGGLLLLGGLGVFLSALRLTAVLTKGLPTPDRAAAEAARSWTSTAKTRAVFAGFAAAMCCVAGVAAVLSGRALTIEPSGATAVDSASWDSFPDDVLANWPTFRGAGSNGIGLSTGIPVDWDGEDGTNIEWMVPVPLPGLGSPVVWEDSVFLTGADATTQEVYSWKAGTGELAWSVKIGPFPGSPGELPDLTTGAGYAAPSPATDGDNLYVIYASGDLACIDFSGSLVWGLNVGYVDDPYGHSSSLLIFEKLLIVQYDHADSAFIAAYDLRTGRVVWKTQRDVYDTWSSPVLVRAQDTWQLLVNASPYAAAYNPSTGEELWRVEDILGEVASSPAYSNGRVVIVNQLLSIYSVSAADGSILWELYDDLPDSSSPLAYENYVIIATAYGVITGIGAESGEVLWKEEYPEGFYATPVYVDGKIYALDRAGTMRIYDSDFSLISSPSIGEAADATPAFAEGRLYIRGVDNLFAVGDSDG